MALPSRCIEMHPRVWEYDSGCTAVHCALIGVADAALRRRGTASRRGQSF